MPLGTKTWLYTKSIAELERDEYGVYELLDGSHNIIYIYHGKIRSCLLKHFEDGTHPIAGARLFSVEYTWTREKSEQRYKKELAKYRQEYGIHPKFN
ncbi:MAG: excinuclease ABC subunit C [Thaumarchaeota archaeon]|nr:excinuclease ABC subunit C [Nitrososphaerota archaeon]